MENAELVMQLLEEFTKVKPKEIPRELEDYLGYVAKTGDPVYQWSLVKNLFREKLIRVITDFYESTLTVELPPCPNVEPFNYDRMKNCLLERFDTFASAPFTVQRICELLTCPRKEYNRADKYMRAIEKNILVVSTREPGTGKRPLECDNQQETILNGMPDVKLNEADGSLMHVPTDLPYLGAPPASNDVTVETSEPSIADPISDRLDLGLGIDINEPKPISSDSDKSWAIQEPSVSINESEKPDFNSETIDVEDTFKINSKFVEESDCEADSRFVVTDSYSSNTVRPIHNCGEEGESSTDAMTQESETEAIPDTGSIDLLDSTLDVIDKDLKTKTCDDNAVKTSDENEVSSTPIELAADPLIVEEEIDEPSDSEAEATDSNVASSLQSETKVFSLTHFSEINSSDRTIQDNETHSVTTVNEVSGSNKVEEIDADCSENEITGSVGSPNSPTTNTLSDSNDLINLDQVDHLSIPLVDECGLADSQPDSSNDVGLQTQAGVECLEGPLKLESSSEADSMSETDIKVLSVPLDKNISDDSIKNEADNVFEPPVQDNCTVHDSIEEKEVDKQLLDNTIEQPVLSSSSSEQTDVGVSLLLNSVPDEKSILSNNPELVEDMYDQEQREESVIQSLPNIVSENPKEIVSIEDISVDTHCELEEEAMDVDDSSNQMMMVTEGENEGEPMDQSDQLQS